MITSLQRFLFCWGITIDGDLASYPIDDIIYRPIMITSGEAVKYNNSLDGFKHIV
jgi:solute carrier family 25 (adenine nucleotide translocator) protein 4/5/6/31